MARASEHPWHPKYLKRLADIYIDKYEKMGYAHALEWYTNFLPDDLKNEVRPLIIQGMTSRHPTTKKDK